MLKLSLDLVSFLIQVILVIICNWSLLTRPCSFGYVGNFFYYYANIALNGADFVHLLINVQIVNDETVLSFPCGTTVKYSSISEL